MMLVNILNQVYSLIIKRIARSLNTFLLITYIEPSLSRNEETATTMNRSFYCLMAYKKLRPNIQYWKRNIISFIFPSKYITLRRFSLSLNSITKPHTKWTHSHKNFPVFYDVMNKSSPIYTFTIASKLTWWSFLLQSIWHENFGENLILEFVFLAIEVK